MAKTQPKIDDIKGLTQWINFLWLKLKDLFSDESATTNDNYLPKIDDINKKLVKSNINDDGTNPKYNTNTIWHSGNDGSGSGLDADTLDGKHATEFATSAQGDKADDAYDHSQSTHAPANALTNRTIKVNGVDKAVSATTIPLNFVSTDGISVYGDVNQEGILDILFYSNSLLFRGELADVITPSTPSFQDDNLLNGIYDIVPEKTYEDVPNVSCGTDKSKSGMKGSLIVQFNSAGKSLIYHCFNTNNIYICSGTIDEVDGHIIWSTWKRLLTCEDKPQTIQADIEAESIYHLPIPATGTTDYTFYLNGFDGKNGNTIEIDLGTIYGFVNMNKRVVEIYVSPAQPNIDVSFYCAGYSFFLTASYIDPLSVSGNIYYMKFIFLKQTTYWSVDNNIAYF